MSPEYENILRSVESLSGDEQRQLIAHVTERLGTGSVPGRRVSVLELQGLGKDLWRDLDGQEYVDRERCSWNG